MRFTMTTVVIALLALGAALGLAACGSDNDEESVTGQFELVAADAEGYEGLSGEATLERTESGTEGSIELSGLEPDTEYVAHVHAAGCDQEDPGGPHYKFDPDGSDLPPNEIHFSFTANAEGEGEADASNDQRIPDGVAGSIVVHTAEEERGDAMEHEGAHSHSDKIACAELEGGTAPEGASSDGDAMKHQGEGGDAMKHDGGHSSGQTIVVRNGEPVGEVAELTYSAGEEVRFKVRSNVADEVHVHGYDVTARLPAGKTVPVAFPAEIEGIFEVELHGSETQIAELRVNP